jgi:phage terminase large subunit
MPKKSRTQTAKATDAESKVLAQLARKELALHGIIFNAVTGNEYELRGGCRELIASTAKQVVLAGVSDSGKTIAGCLKAHSLCLQYPRCQGAITRKTFASLVGSVLQTYERIAGGSGIVSYGGEKPQWYDYPNGSRIWIGGMDNPDKILSSERDFVYVNQCEELSQSDWETLSTRTTGRNAVVPHPQLYGDCNPGGSRHWIRELAKQGALALLLATHKDNPTIYNLDGSLTASGKARLDALSKLTGLRRKRLFEGIWATAEGAVYDNFNATVHVISRNVSEFHRWFLAIDEGFTNPAVILVVGEDNDGRWHCVREFYQTGVLQETIVKTASNWFTEFECELAAVDESAAGLIADLLSIGVTAVGGKGRVLDGIQRIQNRLEIQGDGRPRLTIDPSCTNFINEMESYIWRPEKDVPVKENDHACDCIRYLSDVLLTSNVRAVSVPSRRQISRAGFPRYQRKEIF